MELEDIMDQLEDLLTMAEDKGASKEEIEDLVEGIFGR